MTDTYHELHRPQFHFSARENWLNDPNGLVFKDGVWHLYFQHNPEAPVWGNITWGRATSSDLIHWEQHEHALCPDELGIMFSGSAVVDENRTAGFGNGTLLAFYTAAGQFVEPKQPYTQCLAHSTNNGDTWEKYAGNPIVPWIEADNRDPKVIWHTPSRQWIMALYLTKDRYCLLRSKDAKSWERFQDITLTGDDECPDFFPLIDESGAERWVFWGASGSYLLGSFDGESFLAATDVLVCERGPNGYAAQTWSDVPDGRRIQISWMAKGIYPEMPFNQQMSIPVELTLAGSGGEARLIRRPVVEVEGLWQRTIEDACTLVALKPWSPDTDARLLDLTFTLEPGPAESVRLYVRGQPMTFDLAKRQLTFQNHDVELPDGPLEVRLLIDLTSIEVFVNDGAISASFCFLPAGYLKPLTFWAVGGDMALKLTVHELRSIWP